MERIRKRQRSEESALPMVRQLTLTYLLDNFVNNHCYIIKLSSVKC